MGLEIKNINFSYKNKKILNNISFTAPYGKVLSILGANGAGKSTLIKCIIGILKIKSGEINLDGVNFNNRSIKEKSKLIAYVPQFSNETEINLTVFDMVLLGRFQYKKGNFSENDMKIALDKIEKLNLDKYLLNYVNELSGGEKQRVLLARALAQETNIIILDEPTSNLDLKYQVETMKIIKKLAKEKNMIVINIIHDLNLASIYSDEVIFLKDGKLYAYGDVKELIHKSNIKEVFDIDVNVFTHNKNNYIEII